jgi:hypothetical protein
MYEKTEWKARKGANLNRFEKSQETNRSVILTNVPSSVTEQGTPFSAENMNKIEQGIFDAHEMLAQEERERTTDINEQRQALETETQERKAAGNAEAQTRAEADQALQQAISDETVARIEGDTNTLTLAKAHTDAAQLATQTWLSAVTTIADLPITGLEKNINYLCRVINDPDKTKNGVYQCIAGWEDEPLWSYFGDNADFIDPFELEQAVDEHNENEDAHADIRETIAIEIQTRKSADQHLQEQIDMLSPEGLEDFPDLIASKQNKITATGSTNLLTAPDSEGGQPGKKPMGAPNGVATLDSGGKVPDSQLPTANGGLKKSGNYISLDLSTTLHMSNKTGSLPIGTTVVARYEIITAINPFIGNLSLKVLHGCSGSKLICAYDPQNIYPSSDTPLTGTWQLLGHYSTVVSNDGVGDIRDGDLALLRRIA